MTSSGPRDLRPEDLVRRSPTVEVPLDQIVRDDTVQRSDRLVKYLVDFWGGKTESVLSRLPLAVIDVVIEADIDGKTTKLPIQTEQKDVNAIVRQIKAGARPTILVYEADVGSRYISSDDAVVVAAYRALRIEHVPCQLFGSFRSLREGGIRIRNFKFGGGGLCWSIEKCADVTSLPAYFGDAPEAGMRRMLEMVRQVEGEIREFVGNTSKAVTHWNNVIFSVCERLIRLLESVDLLLQKSLFGEVAILVRSVYELALTFHLDWLAPEFCGVYLQQLGYGRRTIEAALKRLQEKMPAGADKREYKQLIAAHRRMYEICTSPSQKARIAPIGCLHDRIYSSLSGSAHQEFSSYAVFARRLDREDRGGEHDEEFDLQGIFNVVLCAATSIVQRVRNEIGGNSDSIL